MESILEVGKIGGSAASSITAFPPLALQIAAYAQRRAKMVSLNPILDDPADCLKAEELEGMHPLGEQGVGSLAARAYLAMYPYSEGIERSIYEIPLPPPMAMELVVAEGTVKDSHD